MVTDTQEPVEPETITVDETDSLIYSRDWDADEEEILLKVAWRKLREKAQRGKPL